MMRLVQPEDFPAFDPHPLLRNAHAMTVAGVLAPRRNRFVGVLSEQRLFRTEDHTQVLAWCEWQPEPRAAPTLLLLHGLAGSADSVYVCGTADKAYAVGFNTVRLNIRNCGDTHHLTPTLYHSGLTGDLHAVLTELHERDGLGPIVLAGFSLGGNIILKLLGELASARPDYLFGAVAVSPPIDLATCSAAIEQGGFNEVYQARFLRRLKATLRRKAALFPAIYDLDGIDDLKTLREFDDRYTAPHMGFGNAANYYAQASSLPYIAQIRVPTLIISARDDAFIPAAPLDRAEVRGNPAVSVVVTDHGGHVAFIGRRPAMSAAHVDADRRWAENRIVQFASGLVDPLAATG